MTATHPSDCELADFLLGKLPDPESVEVEGHLAACDECRDRAASTQADDTLTQLLTAARTRADAERSAAPDPDPGRARDAVAWSDRPRRGTAPRPARWPTRNHPQCWPDTRSTAWSADSVRAAWAPFGWPNTRS